MKQETINEAVRVRYNFALKSAMIIEALVIVATIAVGYIFLYFLRDMDIVDSSEAKGHINNTTDLWVKVAAVSGLVIVLSFLFLVIYSMRHKGD